MSRLSSALGLLLTLLLLTSACDAPKDATEILVVVNSGLTVGDEPNQLRSLYVMVEANGVVHDQTIHLGTTAAASGQFLLPASYSLVPNGKINTFKLTVTGRNAQNEDLIEQKVRSSFRAHERLLLPIYLLPPCVRQLCRASGMPTEKTCLTGSCEWLPTLDLPVAPAGNEGTTPEGGMPQPRKLEQGSVPMMVGECVADADCAAKVSAALPAGCAAARCDGTTQTCMVEAADTDNDQHRVKVCALPGTSLVLGDDCDDSNASLQADCTCAEGTTRPCGPSSGACRAGTQTCRLGAWSSECEGAVLAAASDTCDPGNDATCNGVPNEGCGCINGLKSSCAQVFPGAVDCASHELVCMRGTWPSEACPATCDDCPIGACGNGSCVDDKDGWHCSCGTGFTASADGKSCAAVVAPAPCAGISCGQNASCTDGRCVCDARYVAGLNNSCILDCAGIDCGPGGSCAGGVCSCAAGYALETGRCVDPCPPGACANGTCNRQTDTYSCTCNSGYTGTGSQACSPAPAECPANACTNGTCVVSGSTWSCSCNTGYLGSGTQACTSSCPAGACGNGICVPNGADWSCTCNAGYAGSGGKACSRVECPAGACTNGSCTPGPSDYSCTCNTGFSGTGTRACTPTPVPCPTSACANGTCTPGLPTYTCQCPFGFIEIGTSGCVSTCGSPGLCPGGRCIPGETTYTCECAAGWTGTGTSSCKPVCDPNPCGAGTCVPGTSSYTCDCPLGYTGTGTPTCTEVSCGRSCGGPPNYCVSNNGSLDCICGAPFVSWQGGCVLACRLDNCRALGTCTDTGCVCNAGASLQNNTCVAPDAGT